MTGYDDDYDDGDGYLIENRGDHKYLRRIPWPGRKKKYRYVYDPYIAAKLPVTPSPGEKVRVPHGEKAGHYEVLSVKQVGNTIVADLRHDETGHRMLVRTDALHKIVQDVFMPPGTPPRRMPSKQEAAKIAVATAKERAAAQKQARAGLAKLKRVHARADALPRERWKVLDIILDDNKIRNYDLSVRDQQYLAWQRGEAKKPPPLPKGLGLLDAFMASGERKKRYCCLREAFNDAIVDAKTWRDVEPALEMLRTVPGFDSVRLPADVLARHGIEQEELRAAEQAAEKPEAPAAAAAGLSPIDYARYGVPYDPNLTEDDMAMLAATHDFLSLPPGRQPGEDEGEVDDLPLLENPWEPTVWMRYRHAIGVHRDAAHAARVRHEPGSEWEARQHDREADRLEQELAEWRAGPGADEPRRRGR